MTDWVERLDQYILAVKCNKMEASEAFRLLSKERLEYLNSKTLDNFKAPSSIVKDQKDWYNTFTVMEDNDAK